MADILPYPAASGDIARRRAARVCRPGRPARNAAGESSRVWGMNSRAVLVTGASRGIGRAIAVAFAERGDRVAIHHRDSADLAASLLAELPGSGHTVVQADLTDPAAVRAAVDGASAALGGLDVLVNNAGVFFAHAVTEVSYEEWQAAWQQTLGVNLIGAANVTWCAVQHMIAGGGGRIVNVSSRGAFRGEPGQPAYGASKGGLNSFGQSLARALAPHGIAVGTVAPGYVDTDMAAADLAGPSGDEIRAQSPFGRVAEAAEIAAAVLYLASPEAEWATGSIIDLNGASYLRS
jgi:3-oxoacyl-[acyl-carrier protein] reductase